MPRTLLVVDDSMTIHRVVELTLAGEGIDVVGVTTRSEALGRLESSGADIILADVGRPEPDGCALAAAVRGDSRFARVPIVLLTSALEPLEPARAAGVPHDAVLSKPFDPRALTDAVTRLIETAEAAPAAGVAPPAPASQPESAPADGGAWPAPDPLPPSGTTDPLDAYFDRLDAAFADLRTRGPYRPAGHPAGAGRAGASSQRDEGDAVATWDPELGEDGIGSPAALPEPFAGLFAPEAQEPVRRHAVTSTGGDVSGSMPALSDAAIDRIVERVIARMDTPVMRRLVLDTAERLVRDEIARIKRGEG